MFLFCPSTLRRGRFGILWDRVYPEPGPRRDDADDQDACIRKVRKFIYYKLHKRELCHEPDGRIRESARRAEGDHHIARRVLEEVETQASLPPRAQRAVKVTQ